MKILGVNRRVEKYIRRRGLTKKFSKQLRLLKQNPRHPGLNVELLEPRNHGIYSFRVDKKYRALFVYRDDKRVIEILVVTAHYQ